MVMDEGSTALSDEDLEMLVILRINRKFMEFMRATRRSRAARCCVRWTARPTPMTKL